MRVSMLVEINKQLSSVCEFNQSQSSEALLCVLFVCIFFPFPCARFAEMLPMMETLFLFLSSTITAPMSSPVVEQAQRTAHDLASWS